MSSCGLEQGSKTEWLIPRRLGIFSPREARLELGKLKIINYTTWWQTITGRGTCCRGLLNYWCWMIPWRSVGHQRICACLRRADAIFALFLPFQPDVCHYVIMLKPPGNHLIQQQCCQQSMLMFYLISELRTQQSNRLTAGPAATDQTLKWFKNAPSCSQPKVSKLKSVLSIVRFTLETLTNFKI